MTEFSDRNALARAVLLCLALFGLGLASTVARAQSAGSSPLENNSTTIATAADADAGEITSPSLEPSRSERLHGASDARRDAVSDNASAMASAHVAPKTIDEWKSETMWPSAVITAGNVEYPKVDGVMLFGKLGLDKPLHVAQELSAAKLNVSNGVASSCILATIVGADEWLNKHPVGTFPTWDEYQIGSRFWWDLYKYNNGLSTCASK